MDESVNLKRTNSTSPLGGKPKSSKITKTSIEPKTLGNCESYTSDITEDVRLVKKKVQEVKAENIELRKKLHEATEMKNENTKLKKTVEGSRRRVNQSN